MKEILMHPLILEVDGKSYQRYKHDLSCIECKNCDLRYICPEDIECYDDENNIQYVYKERTEV